MTESNSVFTKIVAGFCIVCLAVGILMLEKSVVKEGYFDRTYEPSPKPISSATGTIDAEHRLRNLVVTVDGQQLACRHGIGHEFVCYPPRKTPRER